MKFSLIFAIFAFSFAISAVSAEEDNDFADFEFDADEEVVKSTFEADIKKDVTEKFVDESDDGIVEDEFDPFSDKDEFEGFAGSEPSDIPDLKKTGEPKLTMQANIPLHMYRNWNSYWIEILFLLGLIVYFFNYAMGKNKNIKLANSWLNAHKSFLEDNFALVGDSAKEKETDMVQPVVGMTKEADSVFTLWCSGRICVEGMLVELKFIKRQDLLSIAMSLLNSKEQDKAVIKVELSKDSMDSFVFAACSKRSAAKMFKDYSDLKQYCISVAKADEKYNLPTGFSVFSEVAEASSHVLDSRVIAVLNKYKCIDSIHISDQFSGNQPEQEGQSTLKPPETKKMLIVSYFISEKTEMEDLRPLMQLVIYLIDKLKRFKLSREGKAKADKNRMRVEEEFLKSLHGVRQEAAAQKNSERRKQEKEKIMNEDNAERQVKLERKMKRKDAKKAQPKMKSMSIHL